VCYLFYLSGISLNEFGFLPENEKRDCNHSLCVGKQIQRRISVNSDAGGTGNYRRIAMLERAGAAPMRKVGEESHLGPHAARIQTFYCV
jgi:hypothetical protein